MKLPRKGIFNTRSRVEDLFEPQDTPELLTPESLEGHVTDHMTDHMTNHVTSNDYDISNFSSLFDSEPTTDKTPVSPVSDDFSNWLDFSSCDDTSSPSSSSSPKSLFKVTKPKSSNKPQQIRLEKNLNHVITAKPQASPVAAFFSDIKAGWDNKKLAASLVLGKIFNSNGDTIEVTNSYHEIPAALRVNVNNANNVNVTKSTFQEPLNTSYMPYSPSQWGFVSSEFQKLWNDLEECVK